MRPTPGGQGPMLELFGKLGPMIAFMLFAIVGLALVVNFIQARRHPEINSQGFDTTRSMGRVSARGMAELMFKKAAPSNSSEDR